MTERGIIWLASYPKSGNTWLRVFLSNYISDAQTPIHINNIHPTPIANRRNIFDRLCGISSGHLTFDEIDNLRPAVYTRIAEEWAPPVFFKVHDAYLYLPDGKPIFPPEATRGIVYIMRNPLDVVISYAHYAGKTVGQTIDILADETNTICNYKREYYYQYRHRLLSWSSHVRSWNTVSTVPRLLIRYEDMSVQTEVTFRSVVKFIYGDVDEARLEKAIAFSRFDILAEQERQEGFQENENYGAENFFRSGEVDGWQNTLTKSQIAQIIDTHGHIMEENGYL